ncbi:MAG: hypothetical protein C0510_12725 [Erythrobacter sp.]|nr:hypothetical protein [Erythrobacter sp.]MBA4165467.1 hypothetical protein [Erythrobacter sp.]
MAPSAGPARPDDAPCPSACRKAATNAEPERGRHGLWRADDRSLFLDIGANQGLSPLIAARHHDVLALPLEQRTKTAG